MQILDENPRPPLFLSQSTEPGFRPPEAYYPDHVQLLINDLEQTKTYRINIPFNENTSISFSYGRDKMQSLQQVSVDLHGANITEQEHWSDYAINQSTRRVFDDGITDYMEALGNIVSSDLLDRYPEYKRNIFGFVNGCSANMLFGWLNRSANAGQTSQDENLIARIDLNNAFHLGEIMKRMTANWTTDSTLIPQLLKSRNSLLISLGLALRTGDFSGLYQDEVRALLMDKTLPEHIRVLLRLDQEFNVE